MRTRTFAVEGMTCAHCQAAVAKALRAVPGVSSAEVDLEAKQATVAFDAERATVEQMAHAVEEEGYRLVVG